VLPSPIVIHVLRPYANEEEYLARERTSIGSKSMLLIDQPTLPIETAVVFDVALTNGQKPIRAEGKVLGYESPSAESPGGLRVRFKRFGAATKAFIDRAVNGGAAAEVAPSLAPLAPLAAETPAAEASSPIASLGAVEASLDVAPTRPEPSSERTAEETSGVHRKAVLPVEAPLNREALLQRLRARRAG